MFQVFLRSRNIIRYIDRDCVLNLHFLYPLVPSRKAD